jgi:hypothetical protein
MKRQWTIRRQVQEYPDGQNRWDQAYQLILEIAGSLDPNTIQSTLEVIHANSYLCPRVDSTSSTSTDN